MADEVPKRYKPQYAEARGEVDAGIQEFLTGFYRLSDSIKENEGWVNSFTDDAHVHIGDDKGTGWEEIRDVRARMWAVIQDRKHTVLKVFPGQFPGNEGEPELMLIGTASFLTNDGRTLEASWSAHAVLRKVDGEWKFARYQVWVQNND